MKTDSEIKLPTIGTVTEGPEMAEIVQVYNWDLAEESIVVRGRQNEVIAKRNPDMTLNKPIVAVTGTTNAKFSQWFKTMGVPDGETLKELREVQAECDRLTKLLETISYDATKARHRNSLALKEDLTADLHGTSTMDHALDSARERKIVLRRRREEFVRTKVKTLCARVAEECLIEAESALDHIERVERSNAAEFGLIFQPSATLEALKRGVRSFQDIVKAVPLHGGMVSPRSIFLGLFEF